MITTSTRPAKCSDCKFFEQINVGKLKRHECRNPDCLYKGIQRRIKDSSCKSWVYKYYDVDIKPPKCYEELIDLIDQGTKLIISRDNEVSLKIEVKSKVDQLIQDFLFTQNQHGEYADVYQAKQCALIVAKEVLNEPKMKFAGNGINDIYYNFWEEAWKELEKQITL
jgi:hypothetical protein